METTITIRIHGENLVAYIPEWDQLTIEHVYTPSALETLQATEGLSGSTERR